MSVEVVCGYKLLRALGASALPGYAALDPKRTGADALCVVEQLTRDSGVSADAAAEFLRDAKRLSLVKHANLARVRDVLVGTNIVLLVTDWIDGETLAEITRETAKPNAAIAFGTSLRVIVDLLDALSALHGLRDAKNEPLALAHGEVAPRNVVLAADGRAVLVHPLRGPAALTKTPAPDVIGYLAPEVLLGDVVADRRADVYGVGVLLWEALMGRRMHVGGEAAEEIVVRLLGSKIETPCAPTSAPWASGLAEVVKRATSADPEARYANASEMLGEVRKMASTRVAPRSDVAAIVARVAGETIRARRAKLAAIAAAPPPRPAEPPPLAPREDSIIVSFDSIPPSSEAPSADIVEVVELELPPDAPSRPAPPPALRAPLHDSPPHPPAPLRNAPAPAPPALPARPRPDAPISFPDARLVEVSSTDIASVASLIASTPPQRSRTKMLVVIGAVSALIAVSIVVSLAMVDEKPTPTEHAATAPSASAPLANESPAKPPPTAAQEEPSAVPSALSEEIPWPDTASEKSHATASAAPAPTLGATPISPSGTTPTPTLGAPPAPTPSATPPAAPAATPPPRKKPTVYDPMGI